MTPEEFIAKWRGVTRTERSASQEHFLDLCELLEVPKPGEVDPHGKEYTFDKSTKKIGGKQGFADVWKNHCFAWEYKRERRNLVEAYAQLKQSADAFDNPPLLIVSDMQEIRVHTNFTDAVAQQHVIPLIDLRSVEARELLRNCFLYPERLRPTETRESVTARAAQKFSGIAVRLRQQYDERRVAHFINKLVFCLFAEDIDLLPDRIFADILDEAAKRPDDFVPMLTDLFHAMANKNGRFGKAAIPWFNGGLFDDDDVLPLGIIAVRDLMEAARLDWSKIDPTIFGTLFESGLDDKKRAEMASLFDRPDPETQRQARLFDRSAPDKGVGIHYTDPGTIMKIIEPVVMQPLVTRDGKETPWPKADVAIGNPPFLGGKLMRKSLRDAYVDAAPPLVSPIKATPAFALRARSQMACSTPQSERPSKRGRTSALDQRHGPHASPGGQMDYQFRLGDECQRSFALRSAFRTLRKIRQAGAEKESTRALP